MEYQKENVSAPTGEHASAVVASGATMKLANKYLRQARGIQGIELIHDLPILDLGCGTGTFMRALRADGYRNISGAEGFAYTPDSAVMDFSYERLPYADGSFACVTAWEVLEHLENPFHAMREVKRILMEGGFFLFSVPNPCHIESRWRMLMDGSLPRWSYANDHISILTEEIVQKKFGSELKLIEITYGAGMLTPRRGRVIGKINQSLPANRLFGAFTMYAFEKRDSIF